MTDPHDLVPAFSVDVEPSEAGAGRAAHELEVFAAEHGVAGGVRARLARLAADVLARLMELGPPPDPIVVEADIDQGNIQVVFTRDLDARESVAAARAGLAGATAASDAASVERADDGTLEVWVCFTLPSLAQRADGQRQRGDDEDDHTEDPGVPGGHR